MSPPSSSRLRRALSAAVSLSAIALVMAKVGAPPAGGGSVGPIASVGLIVSLVLLVVVWRKEHAENEAAFAARERQQLAFLKLQVELAKKKADATAAAPRERSTE